MRRAGLGLAALLLAGCGVLPVMPTSTPVASDYIPSFVSPSPLDGSLLSPDGIATTEKMAVRIRTIGCNELSTGTGFAISENTFITNKHVVEGASYLEVQAYDGSDITVTATGTASIADLALVKTETPLPSFPPLASADPAVGDGVVIVGYPNGGELTVSEGQILRVTTDPLHESLGDVFVTSAKVEPGSSGSAALNDAGEVIGVVYAKNDKDNAYLLPVSTLQSILADASGFVPLEPCQIDPVIAG